MIQKAGSSKPSLYCRVDHLLQLAVVALFLCVLSCASNTPKLKLPDYPDFVAVRQKVVPNATLEVYGRFAATSSGKTARSSFNLVMNPGKNAYLEIINPSKQLLYAFGIDAKEMTLLWAGTKEYIKEPTTPQNLQAVAGLPLQEDDLLMLAAGYGLNFPEWKVENSMPDGWLLSRDTFRAELSLKDQISRIKVSSTGNPEVIVEYSDYAKIEERLIPQKITFEVPSRKILLTLNIDKYLLRDEPATPDLFTVQLPSDAKRLVLKDMYHGKPLLLEQQ